MRTIPYNTYKQTFLLVSYYARSGIHTLLQRICRNTLIACWVDTISSFTCNKKKQICMLAQLHIAKKCVCVTFRLNWCNGSFIIAGQLTAVTYTSAYRSVKLSDCLKNRLWPLYIYNSNENTKTKDYTAQFGVDNVIVDMGSLCKIPMPMNCYDLTLWWKVMNTTFNQFYFLEIYWASKVITLVWSFLHHSILNISLLMKFVPSLLQLTTKSFCSRTASELWFERTLTWLKAKWISYSP